MSEFSLIQLRSKVTEHFQNWTRNHAELTHGNGFQGLRKEFLEISNSPSWFSWLYIFLASGQIWLKSAKSVLSCNSWKCLLQVKSKVWENNAWKKFSLHKQVTAPYFKIFTYSKVKLKAIVFFYLSFVLDSFSLIVHCNFKLKNVWETQIDFPNLLAVVCFTKSPG